MIFVYGNKVVHDGKCYFVKKMKTLKEKKIVV